MKEDKKMDLIFNISSLNSEKEKFTTSKKDILKYLKIIGVDTRFISYTPDKIYINNLRFSKFSRKRESIFKKQYSEIDVIRNSLFQKICLKSSKILSEQIKPNSTILIPKSNHLINLLLEPYTRKYGVRLVYEGEYDLIVNPVNLDDKVNDIFENIFNGEGIDFTKYIVGYHDDSYCYATLTMANGGQDWSFMQKMKEIKPLSGLIPF